MTQTPTRGKYDDFSDEWLEDRIDDITFRMHNDPELCPDCVMRHVRDLTEIQYILSARGVDNPKPPNKTDRIQGIVFRDPWGDIDFKAELDKREEQ